MHVLSTRVCAFIRAYVHITSYAQYVCMYAWCMCILEYVCTLLVVLCTYVHTSQYVCNQLSTSAITRGALEYAYQSNNMTSDVVGILYYYQSSTLQYIINTLCILLSQYIIYLKAKCETSNKKLKLKLTKHKSYYYILQQSILSKKRTAAFSILSQVSLLRLGIRCAEAC